MRQRDGGSEPSDGERRFLVKESPNGVALRILLGMLVGGASACFLLRDRFDDGVYLLLVAFLAGLACSALIAWLFPPPKVCVFVGVDGVALWGRVIPYAKIKGVREEWRHRAAGNDGGQSAWSEADIWTIHLDLHGGKSLRVESLEYDRSSIDTSVPEHQNERGAALIQAIEAGLSAWREGHHEPSREDLVARGARTFPEWVSALRRLGSGATAAYRGLPVDVEGLSRMLTESQSKPSMRAAAAIALAAAGDDTASKKLRIAATEVANPQLRIALERVAEDASDDAVAEALQTLEAEERDARTSARAR
ncbi:Hypothetical protein A7982_04258 [Minicystis rosea]|nr:Hypothetical protein A7982_04258 [Minicystis rosea]